VAEFVPYSDENHRAQFLELNVEYLDYARTQESGLFKDKAAVRDYVERFLPKFTEVRPPEGIILILEVDDKVAGMGALKKLDEGVAEVKRMYIRPEYRGRGYGKEMLDRLIEKSKGFGYSTVRLDSRGYMAAALHLYESAGFRFRGPYGGVEFAKDSLAVFMEKKL